jgi:hypothetical protein
LHFFVPCSRVIPELTAPGELLRYVFIQPGGVSSITLPSLVTVLISFERNITAKNKISSLLKIFFCRYTATVESKFPPIADFPAAFFSYP